MRANRRRQLMISQYLRTPEGRARLAAAISPSPGVVRHECGRWRRITREWGARGAVQALGIDPERVTFAEDGVVVQGIGDGERAALEPVLAELDLRLA